jgi:hypothetical protein
MSWDSRNLPKEFWNSIFGITDKGDGLLLKLELAESLSINDRYKDLILSILDESNGITDGINIKRALDLLPEMLPRSQADRFVVDLLDSGYIERWVE